MGLFYRLIARAERETHRGLRQPPPVGKSDSHITNESVVPFIFTKRRKAMTGLLQRSPLIPRALGISAPPGKDVWEIYLQVESRPSILGKISDTLGKRNIDILGAHAQVSDDKKVGYIIFYVEMQGSTTTMDDLIKALKNEDFVLDVKAESRKRVFFESEMFPPTSGGHYRGFFTGASSWAGLVKSIVKQFGSGGEVILQSEGASVGEDIVQRIKEKLGGNVDRETMIDNVKALFRADGLGLLGLSIEEGARAIDVSISDAVASGSGERVMDHFLIGFVRGALGSILSSGYTVEKPRYQDGRIEFTLRRTQ